MWSKFVFFAALSGSLASAKPATVNPRADVSTLAEGSYIFVDRPLLIPKGTTILRASQKKPRGHRGAIALAEGCDLHLGRATGFNIFQNNLILKAGTRLAWKNVNGQITLSEEQRHIDIPLTCQAPKLARRGKTPPKFTVGELSKAFTSIGIVYVNPAVPTLKAGQRTAKN